MMTDREILIARTQRHRASQPQQREVLSWEQYQNRLRLLAWQHKYRRLRAPEHAKIGEDE